MAIRNLRAHLLSCVVFSIACAGGAAAHAATFTWTGGGSDNNWSTGANWVGGVGPAGAPGHDLVFPAGAARLTNNNDLGSVTYHSLTLGDDYRLTGSGIRLDAGGITVNGLNPAAVLQLPIQLVATQSFVGTAGTLNIEASVDLNGFDLTANLSAPAFINVTSSGQLTGTGSLFKTGAGQLQYSGSGNANYSGATTISAGTLLTNASSINADIPDVSDVTVAAGATLHILGTETIGSLSGAGNVILDTGALLTVAGMGSLSSTTFSGVISGAGALTVSHVLPYTLTLSGPNTANGTLTDVGTTLVIVGATATWPGPVVLNGSSAVGLASGATVGPLTVNSGAQLTPGGGGSGNANSGSLGLASGATYHVLLNGTSSGSFSQMNVTGTVALGGATLTVTPSTVYAPGTQWVIINNDGSDAVTGTFAGLPEGATFSAGGGFYSISYSGGTGNDVVLTAIGAPPPPPPPGAISGVPTMTPGGLALLTLCLAMLALALRRKRG